MKLVTLGEILEAREHIFAGGECYFIRYNTNIVGVVDILYF